MDTGPYISFFVAMLAIMNPVGNLAIFIGLTARKSAKSQRSIALSSAIAIFVILLLVVWLGDAILSFFGITAAAFETAGALVIILLGLSMLRGHDSKAGHSHLHHSEEEDKAAKSKDSVAVVPLAIPIVAGPGAITTIIIHAHQIHSVMDKAIVSGICFGLSLILYIAFFFAAPINRVVGVNGIKIATRIMGLILTAIAFQMLGDGLKLLLPGLA